MNLQQKYDELQERFEKIYDENIALRLRINLRDEEIKNLKNVYTPLTEKDVYDPYKATNPLWVQQPSAYDNRLSQLLDQYRLAKAQEQAKLQSQYAPYTLNNQTSSMFGTAQSSSLADEYVQVSLGSDEPKDTKEKSSLSPHTLRKSLALCP